MSSSLGTAGSLRPALRLDPRGGGGGGGGAAASASAAAPGVTPRFGTIAPESIASAVDLPMPLRPSMPRTRPMRGCGRRCSRKPLAPWRCVTSLRSVAGSRTMRTALYGHTRAHCPQPVHSSSEILATASPLSTVTHSWPPIVTGQKRLHSCPHLSGRHRVSSTSASRACSSASTLRAARPRSVAIVNLPLAALGAARPH
mmetsp:Transcript_2104/g.6850  ORF Transcript_2104/g.6850 Transcript_2104/m.6850 type:complete len:200 (+) Transcript_2104:184-783(+)